MLGSNERVAAACSGKGEHLIQPILDEIANMDKDESLWELAPHGENAFQSSSVNNIIGGDNPSGLCVDITSEEACKVIVRAFRAAAEREITVGDGLEIWILKKANPSIIKFGKPNVDTNAYILEKQFHSLPKH